MHSKKPNLKSILTQNNQIIDTQLLFSNPVSKRTFQALPKIYGTKKRKKFYIKQILQQRIKSIAQQIKLKIQQNHIENVQPCQNVQKIGQSHVVQNKPQEQGQEQQRKRFKTQMKSYDKQYTNKLSRPKDQFCNRRYCCCHKRHNTFDNKSLPTKKQRKLNIKLPQIQTSLNIDDLQTKHKVMTVSKEIDIYKSLNRNKFNLLESLRHSHQNNIRINTINNHEIDKKRESNNVSNSSKKQKQESVKQHNKRKEKTDVEVQTQDVLQNKITNPSTKSSLSNHLKTALSRNKKSPHIKSQVSLQKQQHRPQQDNYLFTQQKLNLQKMRLKYQSLHDQLESDDQSLNSSISSSSLSKYIFPHNDNTFFQTLNKKQRQRNILNKGSIKSEPKSSNSKSKYNTQKNNMLFSIPEEDQYVDYLKEYKSMNQKFKIKNLVKKKNFKVFKDQDSVFFGEIINQSKNGQGLMVSQKTIFQGDFQDNQKIYGCQKNIDGIYRGQFVKGVRQGYGKWQWNNGQVFQGQWKEGKKNGFGIWKSPKGDYYQGLWRSNRQHGKGIFKHKLSTYKGQFSQFYKNGQGQQIFINGDRFVGSYKDGKPHGYGTYLWINGSFYQGNFINGIRQGKGKWKQINGTIYQGQFQNDFKNGYGKQTYPSGQTYEGYFINGKKSQVPNILSNNFSQQNQLI